MGSTCPEFALTPVHLTQKKPTYERKVPIVKKLVPPKEGLCFMKLLNLQPVALKYGHKNVTYKRPTKKMLFLVTQIM